MNNPINNGGPAFPVTLDHRGCVGAYGMTLRDWFAGQALNGYLASWSDDTDPNFFEPHDVAKTSYAYADAMLAAREVKP